MATIENDLLTPFSVFDFEKIKKDNTSAILNVAKIVATPFFIFNNIVRLKNIYFLKRNVQKFVLDFKKKYEVADEEQKIELYAILNQLAEMVNDTFEEVDSKQQKKGLFTKSIHKNLLDLTSYINEQEKYYYGLSYPDNEDANNPLFIEEILKAHANSNLQHH